MCGYSLIHPDDCLRVERRRATKQSKTSKATRGGWIQPKLDFSPLGHVARRGGPARHESAWDVSPLPIVRGHRSSLGRPPLAPHQGQRVGDGGMALVIPGGLPDDAPRFRHLLVGQQRDE